jgi:thiamine-monophosphate kinase
VDERGRIAMLAHVLGVGAPGVELGIGDDAAVLTPPPGGRLVWTIDEQVEGVHFERRALGWDDLGWRSFVAAASDVAAMGATPWCALAALVLPDDVDDAALESIAAGQRDAAAIVGAPIVGGNLSRGPALSLATTVLGACERAIARSGAKPGDGVWMAGRVGLAAAGWLALQRGRGDEPALREAVATWRRPYPLVAQGQALGAVAHAAVDVSDGLARDAGHLAEASGVCLVLDEAALVADEVLVATARALDTPALELALYGGEDYALVAASPEPIHGFRRIGAVRQGAGVTLAGVGSERPVEPRGFDHFEDR